MGDLDLHFEINKEVPHLSDQAITQAETRLRDLAEGKKDIVGAAIAVEPVAKGESPYLYQARVVVYARPENVAAVEKAEAPEIALKQAVDAAVRQIRARRDKLGKPWQQP